MAPPAGLSAVLAAARLNADTCNELPASEQGSCFLQILLYVVLQPVLALLLGGAVADLLLGDRIEAPLIVKVVC
ncbi:hypothetical protein [Uliginosibacterium aquaticum]|uniref:Uncharacterized protein n=1 Tax=Uliginosibacterium aquaticum TaxID=2731212 RepID=A0ABX2IEN7_9RHOO|nr:hypothetical protein [Uliginosibacterium aquaticum]NSL55071.1 hypothetical protein [Uliginosibacterium aquaticum]